MRFGIYLNTTIITAGVKQNSKESTGPEKCSTGPKYRNGGHKIC
jgi:hypothetical protein